MKFILLPALLFLVFTHSNKLAGHWESISPTGNVTGVWFKEDNSFEAYINTNPFVSGTYSLRDSTFQMSDNGCMGITGTYTLHFYSKGDSLRVELVDDPCEARGNATNNRIFGRVKP